MAEAADAPGSPVPTDFSDRLSPMLVKELRQGLRTRVFTSVFIILQVLLMFSTFVASSAPQANDILGGFFWGFLSVTLFLVQPLRGVNALSQEVKFNTLELILLTRLDAFRIVVGKWASIVSQSALFTIAVLPYVVLRYFLGGVDLFQDIIYLLVLLFFSAVLTALSVGFSAFRAVLLRGLLFAGAGLSAVSVTNVIMTWMRFSSGMGIGSGLTPHAYALTIIAVLFTGAFFIYYLLDMGAARIAPQAANHATRKRLLALAAILLLFSLPLLDIAPEFSLWVGFAVALIACIDALTESPATTPGIFQGFLYRRLLPPFTRIFLAPGWHTGILYTLGIMAVFAAFLGINFYSSTDPEYYGIPVVLAAIILFPVLITQLFFKNATQLMNIYVVIQCICITVAAILWTAAEAGDVEWVLWMGCFIPHVAFVITVVENSTIEPVAVLCGAILLVTVLVGLGRGAPLFRELGASHKIARETARNARRKAANTSLLDQDV